MLLNFNPLLFLDINNIENDKKKELSDKLMDQISTYLIARILDLLPEKLEACNPQEVYKIALKEIPDIKGKINFFLQDFKVQFYNNLKND